MPSWSTHWFISAHCTHRYASIGLEFFLEGLELGGADAGEVGELADEIGHVGGVDNVVVSCEIVF